MEATDRIQNICSAPGRPRRGARAARPPAPDAQLLRRFVSGSLAERLVRAGELHSGEREASVFFSDIRDYTRLSEPRTASEIFTFLSTYTVIVSQVVKAWGGLPLEFHGDGTMAVFGAVENDPGKETAAVAAACELIEVAESIGLSVGVGIATGRVFLGCLPAADRSVWAAVGNTTILASRLQQLARELTAAVLIDEPTRHALVDQWSFERHDDVAIRGRRIRETLYALPRRSVPAGQLASRRLAGEPKGGIRP